MDAVSRLNHLRREDGPSNCVMTSNDYAMGGSALKRDLGTACKQTHISAADATAAGFFTITNYSKTRFSRVRNWPAGRKSAAHESRSRRCMANSRVNRKATPEVLARKA